MTLSDLKARCVEYSRLGKNFDRSLRRFRDETQPALDLSNPMHVSSMLKWLNCWSCRQFAKDDHSLASESIRYWYEDSASQIPGTNASLVTLSDESLRRAADAYDVLRQKQASWKVRKSGERQFVSVGPTGAAKILFALCPDALPPWDASIRSNLRYDGSGGSYLRFLSQVREIIGDLVEEARGQGIDPGSIPKDVGRPESSLPKLVDEYRWISITKAAEQEK
jgi:hypothetical protein